MLTSILTILGVASAVNLPKLQQQYTRPDSAYIGESITCANSTYCTDQQQLYVASVAGDTTVAPRYVVADQSAVTHNST